MTTDCASCSSALTGLNPYNPSKSSAYKVEKEGVVFGQNSKLDITATAFTDAEVLAFPEFDRITVLDAPILSV